MMDQIAVGCLKTLEIKDWADLKGRTIAIARGSTQDPVLTARKDLDLKIARYEDDATMVTAAVSGQADCVATGITALGVIGTKSPSRPFESKIVIADWDFGIGVKPGEDRLLQKLNEWIAANHANGKLNAIFKKYVGVDLPERFRK